MKRDLLVTLSMVATMSLVTVGNNVFGATTPARKSIEAVPGEFIVKLKNSSMMNAASVTSNMMLLGVSLGGRVKSRFDGDPALFVVKKDPRLATMAAMQDLNANPLIEYAEPNYIYHADDLPNDPDLGKLWGLRNTGQKDKEKEARGPEGQPDPIPPQVGKAGIDINAEKAWAITTGSKKVVVAIIDTGTDVKNPELHENLWVNEAEANGKPSVDDDGNGFVDDIYGYDFVNNTGDPSPKSTKEEAGGHGTHVAGTIGAVGNDGKGVVGVNWNVSIMSLKFLSDAGSGTLEDALRAIDYATKMGAQIESNSWGGGGFSESLKDAIDRAAKKGILFVAAAGNDGVDNDQDPHYPANYDLENVVSVAAIDNQGQLGSYIDPGNGQRTVFSCWGRKTVHLAAPGVNVYSTLPNKKHDAWSGTSMATPHVSGVAALLLSKEPTLTAVAIKDRLVNTVERMDTLRGKTVSGGRVDAYKALTNAVNGPDEADPANWSNKVAQQVSTAHPYELNKTVSFTITQPGAKQISLHFAKFETEANYDKVSFKDAAGTSFGTMDGNHDGEWSPVVAGDTAVVTLYSDDTANLYGFDIDQMAWK